MAFERSPIAENTSAIPTQSQPTMREEMVLDPYRVRKVVNKVDPLPPTSGQPDMGSELEEKKPEETVTLSPQMAALARKEQRFRREEQALKDQAKALEAEKAEIAELKAMKAKLQAKDYSGLEGLVKYDDYTNYLIEKEGSLSPEQKAVKELAAQVEELKSSQKTDIEKRFEAAVQERRRAVTDLVDSNPDFSSIKELKAEEAVVAHILATWEHDNVDLSPEEAAKEVEEILVEKAGQWAALSKLKPKVEPPVEERQLPPLKPGIKTLTNNMAAMGEVKRPLRSLASMSDSERYAEARRRAEEKLKGQTK